MIHRFAEDVPVTADERIAEQIEETERRREAIRHLRAELTAARMAGKAARHARRLEQIARQARETQ